MNIKIGDKINIKNPYTNEDEEYDVIGIDMYGSCTCKRGLNTFVLTREYLEDFVINKKVKYMNFIEAVKLFQLDKNIKLMRRAKDFEITFGLMGINLTITDILAEDWYVVKDEKLHTFEEALKAYKSGKNIRRKGYHYMVYYDFDCEFDRDDIMANDWIIIDKEGKNA
jgi:hypothetical protein